MRATEVVESEREGSEYTLKEAVWRGDKNDNPTAEVSLGFT